MVNKKKPARTCMACNEQKEKNELLRIVKSKDGIIDIDLTGKKFGRWTVMKYVGDSKWLCQCECGTISKVRTSELKNGNSKSCGCLHKM